jgi:chemotaxis signal transduction protein
MLATQYGTLGCLVSATENIIEIDAAEVKTMTIRSKLAEYFGRAVDRNGKLIIKLLPEHLFQHIEGTESISAAIPAQAK